MMLAPGPSSDVNLLVGLLALERKLINRQHLVAAVRQWVESRSEPLGDVLVARGALRDFDRDKLNVIAGQLLERHDGNPDQALASVRCLATVRVALAGIADDELSHCLSRISLRADASEKPPAASDIPVAVAAKTVGAAATAPPESAAGARFRIDRPLAEGNLGSLFLARDAELDRDVVIKQIHARLADDIEAQARFDREVKYAAALQHAGIVPIYGAGRYSDGRRYYAMRYIKGEELRRAIDRCHQLASAAERMNQVRLLVRRLVAACQAMAYAHERGVLHRDIKPDNIMLSEDGETIVIDWGLAKSTASSSTATGGAATLGRREREGHDYNPTQQFQAIGTLAYMSPETAAGELDRVGPRSDVFSLGATLYHLLTGQPAFSKSGTSSEPLLYKVQRGEFPRPHMVWPYLPGPLEAICLKAMARTPEKRYHSARALAEDLERWLADEPVHAIPQTWAGRAARRLRRRCPLWLVAAATLSFIVAGAVGMAMYAAPVDRESNVMRLTAETEELRAQLQEADQARQVEHKQHGELLAKAGSAAAAARTELAVAHQRADTAEQQAKAGQLETEDWRGKHREAVASLADLSKQVTLATTQRDALRTQLQEANQAHQVEKKQHDEALAAAAKAAAQSAAGARNELAAARERADMAQQQADGWRTKHAEAATKLADLSKQVGQPGVDKSRPTPVLAKSADTGPGLTPAAVQQLRADVAELNRVVRTGNGKKADEYIINAAATRMPAWQEAAERGQVEALWLLGRCRSNGIGLDKDATEGLRLYRQAAEKGYAPAQHNLGMAYHFGLGVARDASEAVRWYHRAAEQGHANAQMILASLYRSGHGVGKDEAEAVRWYRKAADQGYASAQVSLGAMYANGHGVAKDESEALRWYRKAADQGYAVAQYNVGTMYRNARGVVTDDVESVRWLRKAAEQGHAGAQVDLGWMYEMGRGVSRDPVEAVHWYRQAADRGNVIAQSNMGHMYRDGRGVGKDDTEAVRWYRKAADRGYVGAQVGLGWMYQNGRGVDRDDTEAVRWYRQAAEKGFALGQRNLAAMYEGGRGVTKDVKQALYWYRLASKNGDAQATANLKRLEQSVQSPAPSAPSAPVAPAKFGKKKQP
jgi:TPR repeat protein/predicted Ser/Thr protein kinase